MVIICPKDNVVIWFCSLHNRPNIYLKGIINKLYFEIHLLYHLYLTSIFLIVKYACMFLLISALKGFNDSQRNKSKAAARWIEVKVSHLNNV